jgi:hypothetical protein
MRNWDLARAAKAKKVGFWAYIAGYFFIFGFRGGAREGDSMRAWGGVRVLTERESGFRGKDHWQRG